MLVSHHYAEPFEQDKMVKTTSHSADRNALPLSLEWWSIMASNSCRWNGDTPLTKFHGGTAGAARIAVKRAREDQYEHARKAAREVLARAAGEVRKDRVRRRAALRRIENDLAPPYLPQPVAGPRAKSGLTPMHAYIWDRCGGRCHYCGALMIRMPNEPQSFTLDHVTPRSRGGTHQSNNIVGSCARCNNDKGSLTGEEYEAVLAVRRLASAYRPCDIGWS